MSTNKKNTPFAIDYLDHVAIYVEDLERAISWYQKVLGLERYKLQKWGEFPVFMLSGNTGVALFPIKKTISSDKVLPQVRIDHFAFRVSEHAFAKAKTHFEKLSLVYNEQDHYYFRSLYTRDPDGHQVELTTLSVTDKEFKNDIT
ncbi:MAG: VOC family protein [Dokdonia sp.]|jgi:catechol 2,3-dioxygenase-like lactoylglutathione lyase family enzyme|nr:glyoxalase [Cytophagaceae bacterium]